MQESGGKLKNKPGALASLEQGRMVFV